jgi:hypothetical protein
MGQSILPLAVAGQDWREGYGVREEVMQDSLPLAEGDWIFRARRGYLSC